MRVSFDYDGTLSIKKNRTAAKAFLYKGDKVYIVTARQENNLDPVYKVAEELGIPKNNVYSTNGKDKAPTLKRLKISLHYDNNPDQVAKIKLAGIKAILVK